MSRKLVLRKETLSELSSEALQRVVGGTVGTLGPTFDCTRNINCINDISFEICPTIAVEMCLATELTCRCVE